jgi:hypothetical protein
MSTHSAKADRILHSAIEQLHAAGITPAVSIDRLMTFAAALAVSIDGAAHTAEQFHAAGDRVAAGALARFEPGKH